MTDQPRWPRGAPDDAGGHGQGGRWVARLVAGLPPIPADWADLIVNGVPSQPRARATVLARTGLTDQHARAVTAWADDRVRERLVGQLRAGSETDQLVVDLDAAIHSGVVRRDVTVWRGLAVDPAQVERKFPVGEVVRDPAPMATAMKRMDAVRSAAFRVYDLSPPRGEWDKWEWTLRIDVPAGTHAAPGAAGLGEWLFPRDLPLRVIEIDRRRRTIHVAVEPESQFLGGQR